MKHAIQLKLSVWEAQTKYQIASHADAATSEDTSLKRGSNCAQIQQLYYDRRGGARSIYFGVLLCIWIDINTHLCLCVHLMCKLYHPVPSSMIETTIHHHYDGGMQWNTFLVEPLYYDKRSMSGQGRLVCKLYILFWMLQLPYVIRWIQKQSKTCTESGRGIKRWYSTTIRGEIEHVISQYHIK